MQSADALLMVTPEYNGTLPAVLKNAVDWTSRPQPSGAIVGKPVAVIGTSGGRYGGAWAHEDTRKTARAAGATVLDMSAWRCHARRSGLRPPLRFATRK